MTYPQNTLTHPELGSETPVGRTASGTSNSPFSTTKEYVFNRTPLSTDPKTNPEAFLAEASIKNPLTETQQAALEAIGVIKQK